MVSEEYNDSTFKKLLINNQSMAKYYSICTR